MERLLCTLRDITKGYDEIILLPNDQKRNLLFEQICSVLYILPRGDKRSENNWELENNELFRQLVAYLFITNEDLVFIYRRMGGERRLVGGYAFPGGHVEDIDQSEKRIDPHGLWQIILHAALREFAEEIGWDNLISNEDQQPLAFPEMHLSQLARPVALINSSRTKVDRVHLGVVVHFPLVGISFNRIAEEGDVQWVTAVQLDELARTDKTDSWVSTLAPFLMQMLQM